MRRHHRNRVSTRAAANVEALESRMLMAIIAVLNTNDSGAGSLRAAIDAAVDGDVIQFNDAAFGEIALASELLIDNDITIHGLGTTATTLSGGGQNRVLNIAAGADVSIDSLTVTNGGNVASGGGILNAGNLALNLVDVTGNSASQRGGGIFNAGSIALDDCTVAGNTVLATLDAPTATGGGLASDVDGGAITITDSTFADNAVTLDIAAGTLATSPVVRGGGIAFAGDSAIALTNVTISANVANSYAGGDESLAAFPNEATGGGIDFRGTGAATLALMNCTIAWNRAGSFSADGDAPTGSMTTSAGGGIYAHDLGALTVTNTILAHNIAAAAPDVSNFAGNTTFAHNLIADGAGADGVADNVNGNLVGTTDAPIDPMLEPLSLNRAPTMTHALLDGTPALDAGTADGAPATDQRGVARSTIPDIGAYELGARNATPSFTTLPSITAVAAEQPFQYDIAAVDADDDALTISASNLPAWLALVDHGDGTATLSGTPSSDFAGDHQIRLTVADGVDSSQQNFTITVGPLNHAPALVQPEMPPAAVAGRAFSLVVAAADTDTQLLSFAVVSKPAWLTVTDNADNTATITGTPTALDGGMHQVVFQVSDGQLFIEQTLNIEVIVPRWTFDDGILGINGASSDDEINVWKLDDDTIRVIRNGVIKNFDAAGVRQIEIAAYDGHDFVSANTRTIPAYVLGGAGNDTLVGGDEADNLVGGGGKDLLDGGGGDDRLDGGDNDDRLAGGDGNDRLLAGNGNDRLAGGIGIDHLHGDAGNDVLYARADLLADQLLGGDGDDFSESDFLLDLHADEMSPLLPMPPLPLLG